RTWARTAGLPRPARSWRGERRSKFLTRHASQRDSTEDWTQDAVQHWVRDRARAAVAAPSPGFRGPVPARPRRAVARGRGGGRKWIPSAWPFDPIARRDGAAAGPPVSAADCAPAL